MRNFLFPLAGAAILIGIWFFGAHMNKEAAVQEMPVKETVPNVVISGHELLVEVVRTPEEQSKGLSGREELAENAGMLFVFERSAIPAFWMKDVNFSIDIIWIDKDRKIVGIEDNIAPETHPKLFRPSSPVLYVLEVNATWAKDHGVVIGQEVLFDF